MRLQPNDFLALQLFAQCFMLNRHLIQGRCYPNDKTGRSTRRKLAKMVAAGYIHCSRQHVPSPVDGSVSPVYYLGAKGRDELMKHFGDPSFQHKPVSVKQNAHLEHTLAMSHFQLTFRDAISATEGLQLSEWFNEYETLNPNDEDKHHRTLFTVIRSRPRLVCNPDAAFLLSHKEHRLVYYVERERGGTGAKQLFARKTPGYEAMQRQKLHAVQFPTTTYKAGFRVVCPVQSDGHRKAVCRVFAGSKSAEMWRFASVTELTTANILTSPVWYSADSDEPVPLLNLE